MLVGLLFLLSSAHAVHPSTPSVRLATPAPQRPDRVSTTNPCMTVFTRVRAAVTALRPPPPPLPCLPPAIASAPSPLPPPSVLRIIFSGCPRRSGSRAGGHRCTHTWGLDDLEVVRKSHMCEPPSIPPIPVYFEERQAIHKYTAPFLKNREKRRTRQARRQARKPARTRSLAPTPPGTS